MLLHTKAKEEFNAIPVASEEVENIIDRCARIYKGSPDWVDSKNGIKTINFAKSICSEVARLTTLGIGIHVEGSKRAEWLQAQMDKIYFKLREWVEYGCAFGTVILKPNESGVELVLPGNFVITATENGKVTGVVFWNSVQGENEKIFYTKLEHHKIMPDGSYMISNRCYIGSSLYDTKRRVDIDVTPWKNLDEDVYIGGMDGGTLFSVLRTPHANNLQAESPLSLPIFCDALEELKDLDVAYSRNVEEIDDSRRTVLLDSDALSASGSAVSRNAAAFEHRREELKLPKYVRNVTGNGVETLYKEINPTLNTETRIKGINNLLNLIGYKSGFSNDHFSFDMAKGVQTATGVEAAQQRTIQFIKDMRDKLESCMSDLLFALNAFADLYALAPAGAYEATYDFGDITYNREEDRARWWGYVLNGKVPAWMYFTKFEGIPEDEAKAMIAEAQPKTPTLFGSEE